LTDDLVASVATSVWSSCGSSGSAVTGSDAVNPKHLFTSNRS